MILSESVRGGNVPHRDLAPDTRIIGGSEPDVGRYSYAVSLQDDLGHFCGGSLIAKDVVLTAAHCQGGEYKVVIGRHSLDDNDGDEIDEYVEIPHPMYDYRVTDNDFNLLFLNRPTTANVKLVKLNSDTSVPIVDAPVTVMGWGDTVAADDIQILSDTLMAAEVNVILNQECDDSEGVIEGWYYSYNGLITNNMLCAKARNHDSCQGDSGGPLVIRGNDFNDASDTQVGVVSWGFGCASQLFPGVYSRVSSAYDWIKEEVCKRSLNPPTYFECDDGNIGGGDIDSDPSPYEPVDIDNSADWMTLVDEDFQGGYGFFNAGDVDVIHYNVVKNRDGVIRIQNGNGGRSSVYSNQILLNGSFSKFRVIFSIYMLGMESDDEFCLDYSVDGGSDWNKEKCWNSQNDFSNKVWYDDKSIEFSAPNGVNSLSIRFRCNGNSRQDDVLIDEIKVQGLAL